MRKKVLSLVFVFCLSLSIYAQKTERIFNNGQVSVEMNIVECNLTNRANPHDYALLKFTNLTNKAIEFKFNLTLWYNGVEMPKVYNADVENEEFELIHIPASQSVEANCNTRNFMKILYKHGNPKIDRELTNIKIEQIK